MNGCGKCSTLRNQRTLEVLLDTKCRLHGNIDFQHTANAFDVDCTESFWMRGENCAEKYVIFSVSSIAVRSEQIWFSCFLFQIGYSLPFISQSRHRAIFDTFENEG